MMCFRMAYLVIAASLAWMAVCTTVEAQNPREPTSGSKIHIGTFDSRALAVAYYSSEAFLRQAGELRTEYEKAKAEGDEKRVKELEAEGPAQQELMHKQAFNTWPVDNILKMIEGSIPEIAKQANVEVIVSKWNIVYQQPGVVFVDVTDLMVKLFNPNEDTLKTIESLQKQDPVALVYIEDNK